jgi:TolA-binding protein
MNEDELIDAYLKNQLDQSQQLDFEMQLESNEALQKKLALRKLIKEGIGQAYAEELKDKLAAFDKSLDGKKRFQFSWKMAAVVVLLVTASAAIYLFNQNPNPYYFDLPESGLPITMGANQDIMFNNAMSTFKMGDFETSGKTFNDLLKTSPQSDTLLYFSGLCDFKSKHSQDAIQKWNLISAESIFFEKAQFRLAIAYWIIDDKANALQILTRLSNTSDSALQENAKHALRALE